MEVYFRIQMLQILLEVVGCPSKKDLLEMSQRDFEAFRADLQNLQEHLDEVNMAMWEAYRAYNHVRQIRINCLSLI